MLPDHINFFTDHFVAIYSLTFGLVMSVMLYLGNRDHKRRIEHEHRLEAMRRKYRDHPGYGL